MPIQNSDYYDNPLNTFGKEISNTGIGQNWFKNQQNWKPMIDPSAPVSGAVSELGQNYIDQINGLAGWKYKGQDDTDYWISRQARQYNQDQESAATNMMDPMFGGAVGGRANGEHTYSVAKFDPKAYSSGDAADYNGFMFDGYDKDGKFIGSRMSNTDGDKGARNMGIMSAIAMLTLGAGAAAMGGGMGGLAGASSPVMGGALGEGALAGSGGFGTLAGTAGAGTAAGAAGGVGLGAVGSGGGFVGEGALSGVGPWDAAPVSGSAGPGMFGGGAAGGGLAGVPPPANPFAAGGAGGASSGGGLLSGLGGNSSLLQYGMPLLGALAGSQGQQATTTQTKELPDYLQGPVAGPNGLINQANSLMNQQMNGTAPATTAGLLSAARKKKKARTGLL